MSGMAPGRIYGDDAAVVNLGFRVRVLELNPSRGKYLHLGLSGKAGQVWDHTESRITKDPIFGTLLYVGIETLLGPIYLGYGWTEPDYHSFNVKLGMTF